MTIGIPQGYNPRTKTLRKLVVIEGVNPRDKTSFNEKIWKDEVLKLRKDNPDVPMTFKYRTELSPILGIYLENQE